MLKMTDEQRYAAVLKELGEVLQDKNTTISCQKWQIDELKEKLAAAEKECETADELLAAEMEQVEQLRATLEGKGALVLNNEAVVALRAINAELREIYSEYGCSSCASELKALQKAIASILPVGCWEKGGAA